MLEQAIVDAAALMDAALKNAEAAIIEKYAPEIKSAVETLLEQDPMEDPLGDPLAMDTMGGMDPAPLPAQDAAEIDAPLGGLEGEADNPEKGEPVEIELSFDDLKEMAAELAPADDEQEEHTDVADDLEIDPEEIPEELNETAEVMDDDEEIVID